MSLSKGLALIRGIFGNIFPFASTPEIAPAKFNLFLRSKLADKNLFEVHAVIDADC